MSYDEFKDLCRASWKNEDYIYLSFDKIMEKCADKCFICNKSKEKYLKCIRETN